MTRVAAAFVAAASIAACGGPPPSSDRFPALGTLVEVTVRTDDPAAAHRAAREAFARAEREWHAWNDGALARHNAGNAADPELAALIERAEAIADASGRLFEPRIASLIEAWGFHDADAPASPPPDDAIAEWRAGGLRDRVDLGAFAKGAAVRAAHHALHAHGVRDALIDAGGDVLALGDAGGRAWRVGIRDPRSPRVIAGLELADGEAVFTSGDYERFREFGGRRYHHLLDPRTGRPAMETMSLTVVHGDPLLADAAATALFVAGDAWPAVAAALGVSQVLRIAADGRMEASASLADRLTFTVRTPVTRIDVADPAR